MKKRIYIFIVLAITICSLASLLYAEDGRFEVSLDRRQVALGESAQLGLSFRGTQSMPAPDIGNISGLEIRYLGPSTMMTVINGQVSTAITHMYTVLPLKIGTFQLGPFSFKYKGDNYVSNTVTLEATAEKVIAAKSVEESSADNIELGDRIFVKLEISKASAYVNELIPVKVKFYVNRLNVSDIQLPTFAQEGFSKIEFKEPKQYRERMGGLLYDVLEFNTNIFGTKSGDYSLGPAKIKCNVIARKRLARMPSMMDDYDSSPYRDSFDDFFTRYEKHPMELKSQETRITIEPIPAEGRPKDYLGAVGDYQFIYSANPKKVKVGDPLTVTMVINGTGNFNTVLSPRIDNTEGFKVYDPQVKTEENRKTFSQVLIPTTDMITQIPKAVFSYFDPAQKMYKVITQDPIPLQVEKGIEESPSQVVGAASVPERRTEEKEDLARDIIYIKESPGAWLPKNYQIYRSNLFIVLTIVPIVLLISLYVTNARRNRIRYDTEYAARLASFRYAKRSVRELKRHLKPEDPRIFYETLFKTLQGYLGNRFYIAPAGTTYSEIERIALEKGVDRDIIQKIKKLFDACDEMRFAFSKTDIYKMQDNVKDVAEIIRYLERRKL
ncbi:MAG: BatD family protein [Candidatus Omnitrophica bacterium]|nr:BatD family protein [Candidatus Omnitrophota bacterium]